MKRVFLVEVEYSEIEENVSNETPVLSEVGVNIAVENLMEGYKKTNSIEGDFTVTVKEVDGNV